MVYNTRNQQVQNMPIEDYVKGVVAAEMRWVSYRGIKSQAIVSRTYALSRAINYPEDIQTIEALVQAFIVSLFDYRWIGESSC